MLTGYLLFSTPVTATAGCGNFCGLDLNVDVDAEVRVAYYRPASKRVRDIYGDGWADYQLVLSAPLSCNWDLFGSVAGFGRNGRTSCFHDKTTLKLFPVSLGLRYVKTLDSSTIAYLGGAASYSFLRIHDHSPYVIEHTRKEAWGGLVELGINRYFWNCAYVSAFFDYYFQKFHFKDTRGGYYDGYIERNTLNMNGYKIGVGLGVSF